MSTITTWNPFHVKDEQKRRIARFHDACARPFSKPYDVAADRIASDYESGVRCICLPRTESRKAQAVEIKVQ